MADIPPNISISGAQTGYQQADVAKSRDTERTTQGHAARSATRAIDEADNSIETTDRDTAVFTDAEGGGGQGRSFEDGEKDAEQTDDVPTDNSSDEPAETHLDLEA